MISSDELVERMRRLNQAYKPERIHPSPLEQHPPYQVCVYLPDNGMHCLDNVIHTNLASDGTVVLTMRDGRTRLYKVYTHIEMDPYPDPEPDGEGVGKSLADTP
jgi:hypothetical protein